MRNFYVFARIALFCIAWLVGFEGLAQSRYWVGGSGNWSDTRHWSYQSGGQGGASIPAATDVVVVDKNSFKSEGTIVLEHDVVLSGLIWSDDVAQSGFEGNYEISINGVLNFGTAKSWDGTLVLSSAKNSYVSFPSTTIRANVIFESQASYNFITGINTLGRLEVKGDKVDFMKHIIKAKPLVVSSSTVKATAKSGFLKATQSDGGVYKVNITVDNPKCPGGSDGKATVTSVENGTAPYKYQWKDATYVDIPGETSASISGLSQGFYIVKITDSSTPTPKVDLVKVGVQDPNPLTFDNFTVIEPTCNGSSTGILNSSLVGGTPQYTYSLDNGTNFTTETVPGLAIAGLAAGTYNLVIKDKNLCVYNYPNNPIVINQPDAINITTSKTDVTGCFGNSNGTLTITASGGTAASPLEYSIDGAAFGIQSSFTNLLAKTYTVAVRRANDHSCVSTADVIINQPAQLSATVVANPVSGCSATPDGQIIISAAAGGSGVFEYSIDGGGNWSTSGSFTGLTAATYNVQIRDANNPTCIRILDAALQVTAKPELTATVSSTNATCKGSNNGSINITTPQGGSGVYEYSITGTWVANGAFTNLAPATYTVKLRDKNNPTCSKTIATITITEPVGLSGTIAKVDVTGCSNASNGSITINAAAGGSGQYEFSIDGTTWVSTSSFTNLIAKTYAVSMRDKQAPACVKPLGSVTLLSPAPLVSTFTKVDVTGCAGNNNGSITFTGTTGGGGVYDFSINNGATWQQSGSFLSLVAGSYTLVVRDRLAPTCTAAVGSANIIEPVTLAATVTTGNIACAGTSTGTITVSAATGGSGTFEYSKDNGATWQASGSFTNLPAATYQVVIRDAGNKTCAKVLGSYTISQAAAITATVSVVNVTGCFGSLNGSLNITNPQGGSGGYEYSKDNTTWVTSGSFTNLAAGSYTLYIRDVANKTCSVKLGDYTVTQPANISINSVVPVDPKCFGDSNGSITVNATGGTAPLTYSIGGLFQSQNLFSNLAAGSFTVTVKDNAGCTKQSDVTLNAPQKIVPTATKTDVTCAGPNTGQIAITGVTGGIAPYQYSIQGGATGTYFSTTTFSNLAAGTYNVRVKDANGCESDIISLVVKGAVTLDAVAVPVDVRPCNGDKSGAINLTINSGTAPYQYNIGAGNKPLVGTSIIGLGAGNYNLTITDGAGCVKNLGVVVISEPSPIQITGITPANVTGCATTPNGSIFIAAGAGADQLSYSVDNGVTYVTTNNITGLGAGTYHVKVKNNYGCVVDGGSVTITAPNPLTIDLNATTATNVKCNGDATGAIVVVATGGTAPLTYSIGGAYQADNKFNSLQANTYTVSVKDNSGCLQTAPVTVTQPNLIKPNLQVFNVSCNGLADGRILVAPTGGVPNYTVTLNPTATFVSGAFNGLTANTYTVTVKDANNCLVTEQASITQPAPISITSNKFTNPTCTAAGTITVTATGGTNPLKFSLMQGGAAIATNATGAFTNVSAGSYTVEVTDANNCTKAVTPAMALTSPSTIKFSNIAASAITCNGGTSNISLTVSGIVGTPTVTFTKGGVAVIPAPTVTKVGADYTVAANNLTGGAYIITVTDSNDPTCSQSQSIDIVEPTALVLGAPTVVPPTSGNNGSISIIASGGTQPYTYTLNPGGVNNTTGIFSGLAAGAYTIAVADKNGCAAAPVNVVLSNLSATLAVKNVSCYGAKNGEITVDILGGVAPYSVKVTGPNSYNQTFVVATLQQVVTGLDKGAYSVVVTDNNGTSVTKTATLTEPAALTMALQNGTVSLCAGATTGKIDVAINGGTAPYTITWVGDNAGTPVLGGTLVGQSITDLVAAHYVVTVTDANGCAQTAEHTIAGNPVLNLTVTSTNPQCGNPTSGTITLTAAGGNGVYSYTSDGVTFNNTTGAYTGLTAGTYKVAVKDGLGCQSSTQDVTLTAPTAINIVSVDKTDTKCSIGGTVTVVAAGGSGVLTYKLLRAGSKVLVTSNTTGQFVDVALGNYIVEVTDGGTCPATWPNTISIVSGGGTTNIKVITYTVNNIKCFGDKGSASISVTGVQGTLSCVFVDRKTGITLTEGVDYLFKATAGANPGDYLIEVSGFNAGSYNMFISDDNACPQKFPFGISAPTKLVFDSLTKVDPASKTSANGSITAVVSGGMALYTYSLEGTAIKNTTGIFTGLNPGKYRVVVEDKNHCLATSDEIELVALSNLNIDDIIITSPKCHAETNGSIDIYASGGTGAMKYSIDGGATFQNEQLFSNLKAGVYEVVVEDAAGVRVTQQVTLADPDPIVVKVVRIKTPSADGATDGSIVVIATGGTGLYSYSLVNENTGQELSNATTGSVEVNFNKLPSGTYRIIATDENGCIGEVGPIALEELSLDVTVTDVACNNAALGKLDISVVGGVGPFKLTWQPKGGELKGPFDLAERTYAIPDLAAGDYVLSISDATNSVYTTTITVKSPVTAAVRVTKVPLNKEDATGEISVTPSGGSGTYKVTLTSVETGTEYAGVGASPVLFSKLLLGSYKVVVTDVLNGCTYEETVVIGTLGVEAKGISGNCNNPKGSIEVTVTGGVKPYTVTYTRKGDVAQLGMDLDADLDGKVVFADVDPGDYTVKVVDASNVERTIDVTVSAYTAPTISLVAKCFMNNDYYIEIAVPEGLKDYTVKCTDADGVEYNSYDPVTHRITKLQPNKTYSIRVIDAVGCASDVLTVEIATLPEMKVEDPSIANVLCHGGATGKVELKATGGTEPLKYSLTLADNLAAETFQDSPVFDGLLAGKYVARTVDAAGCYFKAEVEISQPTELVFALDAGNSSTSLWCAANAEGKLAFNVADASPGYTISLYDAGNNLVGEPKNLDAAGNGAFEALRVGNYKLVAIDKNGCEKAVEQAIDGKHIVVDYSTSPSECRRFVNPDDAKTSGGVFTLKSISGEFDAASTYYFKKGANLLSEPVEPTAMPGQDGYYTFEAGKPRTISQLQGVGYSIFVKVVDPLKGTCEEEVPFKVGVKPQNDFTAIADPDKTVCINTTLDFNAQIKGNTDESKYEFENGVIKQDNNFNPVPKRYFGEWTNVENSKLDVEYTDGVLTGFTKAEKLSPDKVMTKAPYKLLHPYIFRVISHDNRCYDVDTAKVSVHPYSSPYFSGPLVKEVEGVGYFMRMPYGATQSLQLKYGASGFSPALVWNPAESEWLDVDADDNTKITINDKFGEEASLIATVSYKVNETETCEEYAGLKIVPMSTIYPPNAFTPNGDGYNDTWRVIYDEEMVEYPNLEVEIYNRWGSLVYHSKPYKNDWNGKHNGKDLPVGTYYYVIKLHKGKLPNISGSVSIIR